MSGRSGPRAIASASPSSWVREIVDASADLTCVRQRRAGLGPKGLSDRQDAPGQILHAAPRRDGVALDGAAEMNGKQLDTLQGADLSGPQELVRLDAPEHVELGGAVLDGRTNGQTHQHQTDAVGLVLIVEAVLVEVEPAAVIESVHHRRRLAVQAEDVHPEPAALERAS